jgi:hypothetical protein
MPYPLALLLLSWRAMKDFVRMVSLNRLAHVDVASRDPACSSDGSRQRISSAYCIPIIAIEDDAPGRK